MIQELPPRQKEVLYLIDQLSKEHGYPPTLAELAKALGLKNRMTVHQHVAALKKKGLVTWEQGLNRSLRIVDEFLNALETEANEPGSAISLAAGTEPNTGSKKKYELPAGIPLVGRIAAGSPIDAIESDECLEVESRFGQDNCFALKVKGDSMIEAGIFDGDFVIIKPKQVPANGEIVVALLDDGTATLKHFYKEGNRYRLQPANSNMEPIYVEAADGLQIQGVVVGLFRNF